MDLFIGDFNYPYFIFINRVNKFHYIKSKPITANAQEHEMKSTHYENIVNKERFVCPDPTDVRIIDGIEYLRVLRESTRRECLVRRDSLRKVAKTVEK